MVQSTQHSRSFALIVESKYALIIFVAQSAQDEVGEINFLQKFENVGWFLARRFACTCRSEGLGALQQIFHKFLQKKIPLEYESIKSSSYKHT